MEIIYTGENLFLGQLGNLSVSLAFAAGVLSFVSYILHHAGVQGPVSWKTVGRQAFRVHSLAVLTVIGTLFYILVNHRFEYHYAWQHTSRSLPFKYVFAAFWEGQEGSFLLWSFWNVVLGNILLATSKDWEAPVMAIFALVQAFLISMIMGVVIDIPGILQYKIGSNPFILTREHPNMAGLPFVSSPTYLERLDGRGLNPALQNYWMTIHPPTLFLGFALTLVPYAYAVAGIWTKKLGSWMKPAIPWAFTGVMVLGGGILMGGAWAYEALNFGGFWAWDPVENSSLVPWLCLAGAAHLMVIPKNKGFTLIAGIVLSILSFILVLYSTFLTRSGILGDASVHSFTDLGMSGQLLVYLFFFIWLPVMLALPKTTWRINFILATLALTVLGVMFNFIVWVMLAFVPLALISSWWLSRLDAANFPKGDDESIYSREFWMFVGALLLLASGIHLTFETSKPVINKIAGTSYAPGEVDDYNVVQAVFGMIITLIIAFGQYMRYRKTEPAQFWKSIRWPLGVSVLLTIGAALAVPEFSNPLYIILAFTSGFCVLANVDYIVQFVKGKWRLMGPSFAHVGFGLIILGSVISAGHKKVISENRGIIDLEAISDDFKNNENIMLHKNDTVQMGDYYITYRGDTMQSNIAYYRVDYLKKNKLGQLESDFTLYPKVITNDRMGNVPEPSTKHYLTKDIFTHVTYVDLEKLKKRMAGIHQELEFEEPQHYTVTKGDKVYGTNFYVIFEGFEALSSVDDLEQGEALNVKLRGIFIVKNFQDQNDTLHPIYEVKDNFLYTTPDFSESLGLKIVVDKILDEKQIEFSMTELKNNPFNDFIIMKAIIFPGINILWMGCFLMVLGTALAIFRRIMP